MMTSKCKHYCSVPQCCNYRTDVITMHMFPTNNDFKEKWRVALKIGKSITRGMMVCSEHFQRTDFHPATELTKKKFLKRRVVPSLKIPDSTKQTSRRKAKTEASLQNRMSTSSEISELPDMVTIEEGKVGVEPDIQLSVDVGVQVNTVSELTAKYNFEDYLLSSTKKIQIFCGISKAQFVVIEKAVRDTLIAFPTVSDIYLNKKICLVLTKLKLNLSFRVLGVMLEISSTTAQNYFKTYVKILYHALRSVIYFTTKEENMNNLPQCFQKYRDVRIIINTTEVPIQKTNCLHYKKSQTAKFLISTSPAGLICHVSSSYGGRVSNETIFNNEKLIDKLEPFHDAIMVDKGFLIEKKCLEKGIKLIRPPFKRRKKQLTKEEVMETASIARARAHVERTIQRIKIFKIFTNRLNWTLVPYLDEMFVVVCAILNLSKPILSDARV